MNKDENHTDDIVDSTAASPSATPHGRRRRTFVLVAAALTSSLATVWLVGVHGDRAPAPGTAAPAAAGRIGTYQLQVPSWRPSTTATVGGQSLSSMTSEQVPAWRPSAEAAPSQLGQTYREQVPRG